MAKVANSDEREKYARQPPVDARIYLPKPTKPDGKLPIFLAGEMWAPVDARQPSVDVRQPAFNH